MAELTQNYEQAVQVLMPDAMTDALFDDGPDPLLDAFPFDYVDADMAQWDMWENAGGLIPLRGLDAAPDVVPMNGFRRQTAAPGYFGMETQLRESEITKGVQPGTVAEALDVGDRLAQIAVQSSAYVAPRIRKTCADLIISGKVDIQDAKGRRFQYQMDGYAAQLKVPAISWATPGTAVPIFDLLGWQAALQKGTSSRFGSKSVLLANSNTIAELFAVAQIVSTYRSDYGSSIIGLKKLNDSIQNGFELPTIVRYDKGYYPTAADAKARTNWQYIIPNRTLIWIGERPNGQKPGKFQFTRHAGLVEARGADRYPSVDLDAADARAMIRKGLYVRAHYHNRMPHRYDFECGYNGLPVPSYVTAFASVTYS